MKTDRIQTASGFKYNNVMSFRGKRLLYNTVSQLTKNNEFSLTEPNQRAILNAITELGKTEGLKNVKFLMNAAAKNKYSTKITLENAPKNNWTEKLVAAALSALAITAASVADTDLWIDKIKNIGNRNYNNDEKSLLKLRDNLLKAVDLKQIEKENIGTEKDFVKNLDYFIISSETTTKHKRYVLERLNYFMSDEYGINPQLEDKKSVVAAEIINDLAIAVPDSKVPNIKAVNQKQHGMCAAISIVRKKLAYEDKPNYIDSMLSELDNNDYLHVYDRSKLGTGEKVYVPKIYIDYNAAINKGYRIIDTATMYWMHIANMTGANSFAYNIYNAFDAENFDVKTDSFFDTNFEDEDLSKAQKYYQALVKANDILQSYKAQKIKKDVKRTSQKLGKLDNVNTLNRTKQAMKDNLAKALPDLQNKRLTELAGEILALQKDYSYQITKPDFEYIPNEEDIMKQEKINKYISSKTGNKLSESALKSVFELVEFYNELESEINTPSPRSKMINKASSLYEIGAAFRYAISANLDENATLENHMRNMDIYNKEYLVMSTIDDIVMALYEGTSNENLIVEHFREKTGKDFKNKKEVMASLLSLREDLENAMTKTIDEIYSMLGLGNRRQVLSNYINKNIEVLKNGDNEALEYFAQRLGVKPDFDIVINIFEDFNKELPTCSEDDYYSIYCCVGNISMLDDVNYYYSQVTEQLQDEENTEFMQNFVNANKIDINGNPDAVLKVLDTVKGKMAAVNALITQSGDVLKIENENGDIIFSPDAKDRVIKKLENEGTIPSAKDLRRLQVHLDAIKKDRSKDEFSSRQGKLHDKSLYVFSEAEKKTLKNIENDIDAMYAFTQKEIKHLRADLSKDLEELKRVIGINNGHFWVPEEGSSGLYSTQQVKVLEYMTGRPHYTSYDVAEAIEKIKKSPFSGIGASSVFHDKIGGHAQYIADIAPVKVKTKDENGNIIEETKEVLFNDNTWGASEHENTWVDSMGLTRTDYSDKRGGTLGYITNDLYRNGNLVERINGDMILKVEPENIESKRYKKMMHPDTDTYSKPQYYDVILNGDSPNLKNMADVIHDYLVYPLTTDVIKLGAFASKMTEEQVKSAMYNADNAAVGWKTTYKELLSRIYGDKILGKQINTREDYDKLANDDYLKVVLEKIALKKNYPIGQAHPSIARVDNVKRLTPYRQKQRDGAVRDFKYAFSKSDDILDYLLLQFGDEQEEALLKIKDKYNIAMLDEDFLKMFDDFGTELEEYDGSLKDAIEEILFAQLKILDCCIGNEDAKEDIIQYLKEFLEEKLYFNEKDLKNDKIEHIIKFIDKVFDPENDKEFVKLYRKFQDMTLEEFENEILPIVSDEDLGIKNYTGYDMLKKIQRHESVATDDLMNNVYYDTIAPVLKLKDYTVSPKYHKFDKKNSLLVTPNFNYSYRNLKFGLMTLKYDKLFNRYKDRNIQYYGAYPAYPKLDYFDNGKIAQNFNEMVEKLQTYVNAINNAHCELENYEISHKLKKYLDKLKDDAVPSDYQFKNINKLIGRLITINYNDDTYKELLDAGNLALELEKGSPFGAYRPYIDKITDLIAAAELKTPATEVKQLINSYLNIINEFSKQYTMTHIQERYQNNFRAELKDYIKIADGNGKDLQEATYALFENFKSYHMLNNPEELLKSYAKSFAKDSEYNTKYKTIQENFKELLDRAAQFAALTTMQESIMDAINEGTAINAKSIFDSYFIGTEGFDMSSAEIIQTMVHMLIIDRQFDTALMFLEKLGLNETYVEFASKNIDFNAMKKYISEASKIAESFYGFKKEIIPEIIKATGELSTCYDFIGTIDNLKKQISQLGHKYKVESKNVKFWLDGLDKTKDFLLDNLDENAVNALSQNLAQAESEMDEKVQEQIENINKYIVSYQTIIDMINTVMVPSDSQAEKARQEMNIKFNDIMDYIEEQKNHLQGEK